MSTGSLTTRTYILIANSLPNQNYTCVSMLKLFWLTPNFNQSKVAAIESRQGT